jgi:hypothetical protein
MQRHGLEFVESLRSRGVPVHALAAMARVPATVLEERLEAFRLTKIQAAMLLCECRPERARARTSCLTGERTQARAARSVG